MSNVPSVSVRTGAATLMIGSKPGEGEPSALDLRYQATIVRTARECRVSAGIMTMKVGIEGRVITGPAGGPGTVDVPLRIAVVQEGVNPKTITSKFARVQVTVASAVDRVPFTHIDPELSFPMPQPSADIDSYVVYVGFDPGERAGKEKACGQTEAKTEIGSETAPKLNEAYQPRRSKIALLSARRSAITERAPAERRSSVEPTAGMAAADKTDHRHSGSDTGGDADRRILDDNAVAWVHLRACRQRAGKGRAPAFP